MGFFIGTMWITSATVLGERPAPQNALVVPVGSRVRSLLKLSDLRPITEKVYDWGTKLGRGGGPIPRWTFYFEIPRPCKAEEVARAAPDHVRDPLLPIGPALDEESTEVGWFTDKCRGVRDWMYGPLRWCFGNNSYDEYLDLEVRRHSEYRREMLVSRPDTGVPTSDGLEDVVHVPAAAGSEAALKSVRHQPRIVVDCVVSLRLKLGTGAMDRTVPGNEALVRSEAAKMLRESNMRRKDASAHLDMVEECFFGENTHYNNTRWREKLSEESFMTRLLYGGVRKRRATA